MTVELHALVRTSPKGGPFIGRCMKCGKEDLTPRDMQTEACANPSGMTQEQTLLRAIQDVPNAE